MHLTSPADHRHTSLALVFTDRPVLPANWLAARERAFGSWFIAPPMSAVGTAPEHEGHYVVDDFGTLQHLSPSAQAARTDFWASHLIGIEESAFAAIRARAEAQDAHQRAERAAATTRALLRPPRVRVEVVQEDDHDWCDATIRVSGEPYPLETPHYRLSVGREEPICLSHAQLSALLVAATELCKSVRRHA